jgi:MoaA/NifB/PqqE/SkfB family radical SAM enzyme
LSEKLGIRIIHQFWRKQHVVLANMTPRKLANAALRTTAFVLRNPGMGGVPVHIKVDVAPQCQLRCPICIHGSMDREERNSLPKPMIADTFIKLVDQVRGRTMAMSLYNLGEPLMNKALPEMIRYAADADINTYITTNFSLPMNDGKLYELAHSGLTLLIVAVDGISFETFGQRRVKGKWDLIDSNLRRFAAIRGKKGPRMTLQYIVFDHNRHEVPLVREYCREVGIDDVLIFEGASTPWIEQFAPRAGFQPKKAKKLPLCGWPYLSSLVGPDGNVYGCCHYRMDENYLRQDETKPLGNIHEQSMGAIYSSKAYRTARKMVNNPGKHGPEENNFCSGCPVIQGGPKA